MCYSECVLRFSGSAKHGNDREVRFAVRGIESEASRKGNCSAREIVQGVAARAKEEPALGVCRFVVQY
jgi:hypothetical protein